MIDCGLNRFNSNVWLQEKAIFDCWNVCQDSWGWSFLQFYNHHFHRVCVVGVVWDDVRNGIMTEILKVCTVNSLRCFRFGKGSSFHSSGTWWRFGSYCYLDFNDLAAGHMDRYHVKPTLNGPGHLLALPELDHCFMIQRTWCHESCPPFFSRIPAEDCFVFFCVEDGGKETTQRIIPIIISMFLIFKLFMPYQANQIKLPTLKLLLFPKADWQQVYRVRNRCSTSWKLSNYFSTCLMFLYCELFWVTWLSRFKMSFYWWNNLWH